MTKPAASAVRVKVDVLARVHAGHVQVARPVHGHAGAIVIALAAPGLGPLKVAIQVKLAEERVKENRGSAGEMILVPIMAPPRIKVGPVARKISCYIEIVP